MRWAWLVALGLSGCVWSAQGGTGGTSGGTEDEVVEVPCITVADAGPGQSGISAAHDFGPTATESAFKARVVAFVAGGTSTYPVTWQGTVADLGNCPVGATVTYVVLP